MKRPAKLDRRCTLSMGALRKKREELSLIIAKLEGLLRKRAA